MVQTSLRIVSCEIGEISYLSNESRLKTSISGFIRTAVFLSPPTPLFRRKTLTHLSCERRPTSTLSSADLLKRPSTLRSQNNISAGKPFTFWDTACV